MCFELKFENIDVSHYLAQAFWPIASKKLQPYMIDWSDQKLKSKGCSKKKWTLV